MTKKKKKNKKKVKEKIDPFQTYKKGNYTVIKTTLKSILKNYGENFNVINKLVIEMQELIVLGFLFIRLHMLYMYHNNISIPEIDTKYVSYCLKIVSGSKLRECKFSDKDLFENISTFYNEEFKELVGNRESINLNNKTTLIDYSVTEIVTALNNNIKEHYITRVRRFLNIIIPKDVEEKIQKFKNDKNKEDLKITIDEWTSVKNQILKDKTDNITNKKMKSWAIKTRNRYFPKENIQTCFGYDVKCDPTKYVYYTLKMNEKIEKMNIKIEKQIKQTKDEKQLETLRCKRKKLFQPFSTRSSIIPGYITIDARTIGQHFSSKGESKKILNIKQYKTELWNKIFRIKKKVFKMNNYQVDSIKTDGIGVSILFKKEGTKRKQKNKEEDDEDVGLYIDELEDKDLETIKKRKLISVDPNKQIIVQMIDNSGKSIRYTTHQRKSESYLRRNQRVIQNEKNKTFIEGKTVVELETELSDQNCKTVNYKKFKMYIVSKLILNDKLKEFYYKILFRKLKLRSFIYRKKSEDKFLKRIEDTYGKRGDIFIGYGDWSNNKQMKYIMPTKGIGFRKLINKRFDTALVHEFRTSKLHNGTYKNLNNHKPEGSDKKIHRLLCVDIVDKNSGLENKKTIFVNRDVNACKNILLLLKSWVFQKKRPKEFCRSKIVPSIVSSIIPSDVRCLK
jgi:hypothetical protein